MYDNVNKCWIVTSEAPVALQRHLSINLDLFNPIGPYKDLLTLVKRHKPQWCGHISHSSGLAKTNLEFATKAGRKNKANKGRGGQTSGNGQGWSSVSL